MQEGLGLYVLEYRFDSQGEADFTYEGLLRHQGPQEWGSTYWGHDVTDAYRSFYTSSQIL